MVGSPCSSRDFQESSTPQFKTINSSELSFLHSPTLTSINDHWKNHTLKRCTFVGKVMSLLFNMLSRLVVTFLPRSQFSSVTQSCPTLCNPMNRSTPDLPVHHQLPDFTQTHIHGVGDATQPSHPLSSPSPPAPIHPSIRVFSNESTLHMRLPKYWSFSFRSIPSKEIPGLIAFTMNWLDLLAVQGTLKSLLQHYS